MEIEKAIEVIKSLIENFKLQREDKLSNLVYGEISRIVEALELLLKATEKPTGKKPISLGLGWNSYQTCPECHERLAGYENYCMECGCRIDWSDEQ